MSAADGDWNTTMNTPMGAQEGVLTLASAGSDLTGKLSGAQGDLEITDGKIDGETLTWKAAMTQPMPITLEFTAKVDGDEISGDVKLGAFGNATFTGTRV